MKSIINKCIGSIVKVGASVSSTASYFSAHEPKRPEKLK